MPVEFLSDDQASVYGRFPSGFGRAELERYFFLDDVDRALIEPKRRDHNKLGFAVQLATVRYTGRFLDDPLDGVPVELVDYLAEQLGIADPSCVKSYGDREMTRLDHAREIREADDWHEFAGFADELGEWVEGRAWTTGDGPKALFDAAVGWLRERRALLPGVSTLVRLVAGRRDAAAQRRSGCGRRCTRCCPRSRRRCWTDCSMSPGASGSRCWTSCGGRRRGCRARR